MKARNYRKSKGFPYVQKKYIHGMPHSKIVKFTMGNPSKNYEYQLSLVSDREIQIRHNALEAARVATNHYLEAKLGDEFFLRILSYPHIVLRENKMLFVHHADRFQDGMRKAFGKPVGRAASVNSGQSIIKAYVNKNGIDTAKEALKRGRTKLPTSCRIVIEKLVKPSIEDEKNAS
jgi:large subunit ribosomal protein L10e